MTISNSQMPGHGPDDARASSPYVDGPILRQYARSPQARAVWTYQAEWYRRVIFTLVLALGIVRVMLMLWLEP